MGISLSEEASLNAGLSVIYTPCSPGRLFCKYSLAQALLSLCFGEHLLAKHHQQLVLQVS